ncbi:LuxR family transcriptional regulator [Celeribacter arenosi]|uniref:LuxR family transcriptional regulator n=1 Tax=Celeribacter arenosi TaxID=792649 RepID=A0ABP7KFI2_9RHOB
MHQDEVINIVERLLASTQVEEVWNLLLETVTGFGFYHALYGFTHFHTDYGFGDDKDHFLLTNFSKDYMTGYFDEGRYRNGPIVNWALENVGTIPWSWISKNSECFSEAEKETIEYNRTHGVVAGYTIGFHQGQRRSKAAIGLSMEPFVGTQSQADRIWKESGRFIAMICEIAHLKIVSLPLPMKLLTPRQREVLEWIGDGKTVLDTAMIMGLNRATVEKHLRLARDALGVDTTAQAVLKASFHTQIYVI